MSVEITVREDPAAGCAELMLEAARAGGHVVLTGGSTPREAYVKAADAGADWRGGTLWWGDERCVAPDDERSNFGLAKAALLDRLDPDRSPTIQRIRGELGPEPAAEDYEQALRAAGVERFDLLLLGLGPDGHVASLFPDAPTLREDARMVLGVPEAGLEPYVPRVSMTVPRLQAAAHVVFLVAGESKAPAVAAAFGPGAEPTPHVPASLIAPGAGRVTVLLDPPAASQL